MVTNEFIKKEFIHQVLTSGIKKIYTEQSRIAQSYLTPVTGHLFKHLARMPFSLDGNQCYIHILPYLRYLDIHYRQDMAMRRNLALYNRTVWGVLYGETLPALRYGFTQDVRKYIFTQLSSRQEINSDILNSLIDY